MGKIKQWIVAHKLWSIIIASALVVVTLSIALPLALRHKHTYSEDWSTDASYHWHVCTGEDCDSTSDKAKHTFVDNSNDTQFWQECSVCGYQKDVVTATVDDATLANALDFKDADGNDYANWQAERVDNKGTNAGEVDYWVKYTGDAYQAYNKYATSIQEILYINSYDGTDKVYIAYKKNAVEGWIKTEGSGHSKLQNIAKSNLKFTDLSALTFEYNSADKAYCAAKLDGTPTEKYKDEITYKLFFENGKLISVQIIETKTWFATETAEEKIFVRGDDTWTISYGNATYEIPSDLSYVGSTQWNKALSFDGVTNYTLSSQGGVNSQVTKVTGTQASQETTNSAGKTNIYVYDTVGHNRYLKGFSSEKFTITNIPGLNTEAMMNLVGKPGDRYSDILDSFADFEYKADEKVFYIASATIGGNTRTDVKLTFDNGKLIKAEYTYDGNNITLTYTYGDAVVTIPSESECIVPIEYNSTGNSYKLENVSLKANETRTFLINITSTLLETYKDADGKCMISGEFTTSSSASFTITAKDANGNVVANLAAGDDDYDSNELVFKNLTAGKYYIEITASEECTGAWDIKFVDLTPVAGSSKEVAIAVPFLSTDGKFALNDVTLSATEKWFVFEITEDYFDSNSEDGKCEILGEFTTSDGATLTLTVENLSGTTIYNMSADVNEFHCEISTYGKYYIKVTSSADCTGSWDISFVELTPAPTPAAGSSKETAIAINWSEADGKFVLDNVALSTTDTWLVLEITEAKHSSYKKTSGKYELDGVVTLSDASDAALTIVAENESGTGITNNKSSDNCKLNLTSLEAGKYYIKITADKDCTGSLSIEFKTGKISF